MEDRGQLLSQLTSDKDVIKELFDYTENHFRSRDVVMTEIISPQMIAYHKYVEEARLYGAFPTLQKYLVPLQFPIRQGISKTDEYRDATLKGKFTLIPGCFPLEDLDSITLEIYKDDLIGEVPVIITPNRTDFERLVLALSNKNEPMTLPESMGAAFIKGINNWDRLRTLQADWQRTNPGSSWIQHFKQNILSNPEMYQDHLMILSTQPYSGVSAEKLNLGEETWSTYSLQLRRAHECAHLFTLRHYGKMSQSIFDELIADYVGITHVLDSFNSDWFLLFMGLENYPSYREGGRFQNYTKDLSKKAVKVLRELLISASKNLEEFDQNLGEPLDHLDRLIRIKAICELGLVTLSSKQAIPLLLNQLERMTVID